MKLALSTHWNAAVHGSGEALVDEIMALGIRELEAGYDLRVDLVAGLRSRVEDGSVRVRSVHNYCPVPVGAPFGHPELFLLAARDTSERNTAVLRTTDTIRFAADIGASAVVAHAGRLDIRPRTRQLIELCEAGEQFSPRYERLRTKLLLRREKKVGPCLDRLAQSIEELLPTLERHDIKLAIENLPSWETVPNEPELDALLKRFDTPLLACWHDVGHGRVRQSLGFVSPRHWLEKFGTRVAGLHIHDVADPAFDHLAPGQGGIDFTAFKPVLRPDMILVLEPAPGMPAEEIEAGMRVLREAWPEIGS